MEICTHSHHDHLRSQLLPLRPCHPCFSAVCVQASKIPLRRAAQASRVIYFIRKPDSPLLREITIIIPFHRAAQSIYFKGNIHPAG